jgi:hypothetical protein
VLHLWPMKSGGMASVRHAARRIVRQQWKI